MKLLVLFCMLGISQAATVVEPTDCTAFPCLIFNDDFDYFDHYVWEHEITMAGGGNFEFQTYVNNRSISYTNNSFLYIKPQLTENWLGDGSLSSGGLNLWGFNGIGDVCTGNLFSGCERTADPVNILNPIISARLRSSLGFSFRYGRMEIRAQMPRGDWLWPAAWLMTDRWQYGPWPASADIDIFESRGNDVLGTNLNNNYVVTKLNWGPYAALNRADMTTQIYQNQDQTSFADNFHVWAMEWNDVDMKFFLDDVLVLAIDPGTSFWDFGNFGDVQNPWEDEKMAPYNKKFNIILSLAVGGTGGYFPDDVSPSDKPWTDDSQTAPLDFWNAKDQWLPTWTQGEAEISEGAALKVDYIRVYKMVDAEM